MDPASLVEGLGNLLNRGFDSPWALLIDPDNQYVADVSAVSAWPPGNFEQCQFEL